MELLLQLFLLCAGLILLWKVGELAVRNALGVSAIYGIEKFTIGFFIFAIATGLPEICSAIVSSIQKVPQLSAGDLMGSTFVNISLILGISAIIAKEIEIESSLRKNISGTIALIVAIFIGILFVPTGNIFIGTLLIIIYLGSAIWFQAALPKKEVSKEISEVEEEVENEEKKALLSPKIDLLLKLMGSLTLLIMSSWLTVYSATKVSALLNINLPLLGGTLIAVGTGLPELSLEINAIRRKEYSLALGDIFGSSLLNISLILGMLILANKNLDLAFGRQVFSFLMIGLGWMTFRLIQKKPISRADGYIFIGIFLFYILWVFIYQFYFRPV